MEDVFGNKMTFNGLIVCILFPFFQHYILGFIVVSYDLYFTLLLPLLLGIYPFLIKVKLPVVSLIGINFLIYFFMHSFYKENLTYPKIDAETVIIQNTLYSISYGIFIVLSLIYILNRIFKKKD